MYVILNLIRTTGSGRKSRIKFDDVSSPAGYNVLSSFAITNIVSSEPNK